MSIRSKIGEIKAVLMLNCRDASRMQSEQLERSLPATRRFGLFLHLLICKWCRRYGKQIRFMQTAAREHPEKLGEGNSPSLSDDARERIKSRLSAEDKQS